MTQQNITTAKVIEYLQACHREGRTIEFYLIPFSKIVRVWALYPEFEPLIPNPDTDDGEPELIGCLVAFQFDKMQEKGFLDDDTEANIAKLNNCILLEQWHTLNGYPITRFDTLPVVTRDTVRTVYLERVKEENERHRKAMDAINQWCGDTLPKFAE